MLHSLVTFLFVAVQPVSPMHLYNGLQQGILVDVRLPEHIDVAHVVLLNHENEPLSGFEAITSGSHDLISRIPEIKEITEASWVQLLVNDAPYGTPLVIDPLLSRQVPIVEDFPRQGGTGTYTKIVGWEDEAEEDGLQTPLVNGWRVYLERDAIIKTSEGDIQIAFRPDVAPNTVWNFLMLSEGGFYRGSSFHRIVPLTSKGHPFVIQGGDPMGTGSGGPGYWLPIENSSLAHDFGVISMAREGDPDSAGSQFFICLSREGTAKLDGQYCSFGESSGGEEVILKIAATPLEDPSSGKPTSPPIIENVELLDASPRMPKQTQKK